MTEKFRPDVLPNHAENFRLRLDGVIDRLTAWEKRFENADDKNKMLRYNFLITNSYTTDPKINFDRLEKPEQLLFIQLLDLFALKHKIGEKNRILAEQIVDRPKENRVVGFLAALGNGKTTIAQDFAGDLNTELFMREAYVKNLYRAKSQKNKSYMLRSQLYFLFSNLWADIDAHLQPGIMISDSSTLTDIYMWTETYRQMGLFSEEEHQTYNRVVELLRPVIAKPDLLITLLPSSIEDLKKGVEERIKAKPEERESEKVFLENDNLIKQVKVVEKLSEEILEEWSIPILKMTVNPIKIYEAKPNYDLIYKIRNKLGILGELLEPKTEEVVEAIRNIFSESNESKIILVHAQSMFTGKTSVLCQLAEKIGAKKILAFQPLLAKRYDEQEDFIISRDGSKIPARLVETNSLRTILSMIRDEKITPKKFSYIFIDEVQLFIAENENHQEAVDILEELRFMGFHVVVDGIDFTFQENPFTFMHRLYEEIKKKNKKNWHEFEMTTRCCHCGERAIGTRRYKLVGDQWVIADFSDEEFLAGDRERYEPVCCEAHQSCVGQPEDFVRQTL